MKSLLHKDDFCIRPIKKDDMKKKTPLRRHNKEYAIDEQIEYIKRLRRKRNLNIKYRMMASIEQTLIAAKWLVYCQTMQKEQK